MFPVAVFAVIPFFSGTHTGIASMRVIFIPGLYERNRRSTFSVIRETWSSTGREAT